MKIRRRVQFVKAMTATALFAIPIVLPVLPRSAASAGQEKPVSSDGIIEGRVTRSGKGDGISDAEVTMQGPALTIASLTSLGLYTPRPELTPDMRDGITRIIESLIGTPPEIVAQRALSGEARYLGLPAPAMGPFSAAAALTAPAPRKTTTDTDGRFIFEHLPPGRYRVSAQREGYFGAMRSFGVLETSWPAANGDYVVVTERKATPNVELRLTPGTVISGRVRDPGGRPLVNFPVAAYQVVYREGRVVLEEARTTSAPSTLSTPTDDRGEFRISWLPPGDYLIAADPRRPVVATACSAAFAAACSPPATPQDVFVRTFYSGATDARLAPHITLAPGASLTGVDIQVRADATAKVSGRILNPFVDASGQPTTPSTALYLVNRDPKAVEVNLMRTFPNRAPKSNGLFELQNVPPGSYELWATAPDGRGRAAWGHVHVDISGRDLEDVPIALKLAAAVKIRMTVDGGQPPFTEEKPPERGGQRGQPANSTSAASTAPAAPPVIRPSIQVRLAPLDSPEAAASSANSGLTFDPAGIYTLSSVPEGRYRVTVSSLPTNAFVEDIRLGASIFDEGFTMSGDAADIDVIVRTNGAGAVKGTVTDIEGRPVKSSAVVVLVPQQPRRGNLALYRMTYTAAAGTFEIAQVVPGEYKVFAWEGVRSNAWTNADFLARFEPRGKAVTVTAGAPTGADLIVIPASQTN